MKIPLSPMDYYFYRHQLYTIQFVFQYEGPLDIDNFRSSVATLSDQMPVLTSRIHIESGSKLSLIPSGFTIPLTVRNFKDVHPHDLPVNELLDQVYNTENSPLIKICVSTFKDKTCIGFSFSHFLGDGYSMFLFLNTLSQMTLGNPICIDHSNDRSMLHSSKNSEALSVPPDRLYGDTGYITPRPLPLKKYSLETIRFSHQELDELKRRASQGNSSISTNDAIMAYLLKRYYKSIPLSPFGELIIRCPVDYRKIYPRVPDRYFGNAVRDAIAKFNPSSFPTITLADIANKIRASIKNVNYQSIQSSLDCLDDLRREKGIAIFEDLGCPGLLVSNLTKLPFDKIDLGLGSPTNTFHVSLNPRLAIILPATNGVLIKFNRPT